jgi:AraC-like DNA-binding protein
VRQPGNTPLPGARRGALGRAVRADGVDDRSRGEVASALLVRLTQQELARRGLLPGATPAGGAAGGDRTGAPRGAVFGPVFGPTIGEATVPLAPKRTLLAAVASGHGLVPLLEVGRGVDRLRAELPDDPVLAALLQAADPDDAVARWQRLERFLHSRHRLEAADRGLGRAGRGARTGVTGGATGGAAERLLRHAGPAGAPPDPAEDALVLGVVAELCRRAGAVGLAVTLVGPDGREHPVLADGHFRELPDDWPSAPGATGLWRFTWVATARAAPARATTIARAARTPPAEGAAGAPPRKAPAGSTPARSALPLTAQLTAVIAADLCRPWTLAEAARALGAAGGPSLAPRTLQRRLAAAGATFPGVVRAARVAAAGRLLAEGRLALGVVGFACGFTDQPHFTRQCRRQVGMTPAQYRRAFGPAR